MLNGQNHTVRGLVGAFCKGDLRIRDFTFENGTGNYNIYRSGLLTTDPCSVWARNCTLKNCSASGSYGSIGLFTGHGGLDLDSCLVLNSSVSGGREPMGLLIGLSTNATIRNTGIINCSASGSGQVGLFAAHVNLSLLNCYAINSRVSGGTTGLFAKSCGNAQNCYAIGSTPSVLFNDISGTMKNVFYEEGARLTNGGAAAQTNVCAFNPVSGKLINPPEGCPDMLLKALNSYAGIGSSYQPWAEYWFNYVGIDQQARATLLPAFKQ